MNIVNKISIFIKKYYPELILITLALLLGIFFSWYVKSIGMTAIIVDQNSHLNLSRQVVDSMTTGLSQIGFWPPLLHLVMLPFVSIKYLYHSGLAGAFTLIPFLCMSVFFLYKLLFVFTKNKGISFFGCILFMLNPYILYYSVTPMMEILFIANLFAVGYFFSLWLYTNKLKFLIFTGLFITLASVSRFEGILLVPMVSLFLILNSYKQKKKYKEIEALIILFGFVASLGILFIFMFGWVYGNNPLAFMNSDWSAYAQQRDYYLPTEHSVFHSLQYMLHASFHMIGKWEIVVGLISLVISVFLLRSLKFIFVSLILSISFIFDSLALYRGNAIIYVPELAPFDTFFNERYGLYWIGLIIFATLVVLNYLIVKIIPKNKRIFKIFLYVVVLTPLFILNAIFFYTTCFINKYEVIRMTAQDYPTNDQINISEKLKENYDYGKILITRALHDFVVVNAGIDLKNYVHESNYKYYDQALERPWLFARWIVMYNPENNDAGNWSKSNEKISAQWGNSEMFDQYYTLVEKNKREVLYKVKEEAVRDYAKSRGLNEFQIPSIGSSITWWDVDNIYQKMGW
ncbi:MAG: glycosyltransferase family 39 protein [Parcubacteria group bacterium]|jgi:hypothetical protein